MSAPLEFTRGKSMEEENGVGFAVASTLTEVVMAIWECFDWSAHDDFTSDDWSVVAPSGPRCVWNDRVAYSGWQAAPFAWPFVFQVAGRTYVSHDFWRDRCILGLCANDDFNVG